jgi:hypothetical protein
MASSGNRVQTVGYVRTSSAANVGADKEIILAHYHRQTSRAPSAADDLLSDGLLFDAMTRRRRVVSDAASSQIFGR